jgi:hypothetical protein
MLELLQMNGGEPLEESGFETERPETDFAEEIG